MRAGKFKTGLAIFCGALLSLVSLGITAMTSRSIAQTNSSSQTPPPSASQTTPTMKQTPPKANSNILPPSKDNSSFNTQGTFTEEGVEFQPANGYTYDPTNRRDPFRPYGQSQTSQAPTEKSLDGTPTIEEEPRTPLQTYDVAQFKLLGVVWKVKNPKAVLRDPVNQQHIVYKYTKIGRNNGFIAAIKEGAVVIVEPTIGDNGLPSAITRTLELKK